MSFGYRIRYLLFLIILSHLLFGWVHVIPLLNTDEYVKHFKVRCDAKKSINIWMKILFYKRLSNFVQTTTFFG